MSQQQDSTPAASRPSSAAENIPTAPIPSRLESNIPSGARHPEGPPFQAQNSQVTPHRVAPPYNAHQLGHSGQSTYSESRPYNMEQMENTLPEYPSRQMQHYGHYGPQPGQHPLAGAPTAGFLYQMPQNMPYQPGAAYPPQVAYGSYAQPPYAHGYTQASPGLQAGFVQYPPSHIGASNINFQESHSSHATTPYHYDSDAYRQSSVPSAGNYASSSRNRQFLPTQISQNMRYGHSQQGPLDGEPPPVVTSYNQVSPSLSRGPARKPKHSGHALWVGNLPSTVTILSLKDHFARGFTRDLESVFLIVKSNCAFVNYRSEKACSAAMQQFHDARFEGVKLVCRPRTTHTTVPGAPAGPTVLVASSSTQDTDPSSPKLGDGAAGMDLANRFAEVTVDTKQASPTSERYFIVKSLTLQDLEESVRTKIWATQSHNEEVLNQAYKSTTNVYLIFSANKSGEYFGYARMASQADPAAGIPGPTRRSEADTSMATPKPTNTTATEHAPRGHITDDPSRGTIFWEADFTDDEDDESGITSGDAEGDLGTWGAPFNVEWLSTTSVPFYRTRGMRNPWNANREVKIARDGTELEPGVGQRLLRLFHNPTQSADDGPN